MASIFSLAVLALDASAAEPRAVKHTPSELGMAQHHAARHHAAPEHKPAHGARAAQHAPAHPAPVVTMPPPPAPPAPVAEAPPAEPQKGSVTGLPLPRYASLRTDDVNLRSGPGTRYPIEWVYKRHDLPVEIEREFEVWRLVRDPEGVKGWVHQATLTGRRNVFVLGDTRTLRSGAQDGAAPVAMLKPGVIGRLRACDAATAWCEVQVGDYRGWLRREEFWGTLPNEGVGS